MQLLIAGRYAVGAEIGRGGMGRVFAGRDRRLDRPVAVKLVGIGDVDPAGRERFVREARSAAGFSHPNAVAVFDAGETDEQLFLVMELVDGPSLATLLASQGPMGDDEAVRVVSDVLAALDAAHRAGIVHRDVKPGNVLITRDGDAKLADFGIAKRLDELAAGLTSTGALLGTPRYLAPEQVVGDAVTPAADLYATGVVLYELLAGAPPFDASTPLAVALAHRDAPVPDLRVARPDVSEELAGVVGRAMAKSPADRFASAGEMRRALLAAVGPAVAATGERPPAGLMGAGALAGAGHVPTGPGGMAPTAVAPAVGRSGPLITPPTEVMVRPRRRPSAWWLALALVPVAAVALAANRDSGSDTPAGPGSSAAAPAVTSPAASATSPTAAATSPATSAAAPTTPVTPTAPATVTPPATLEELIAVVELDPEQYGERGPDLLKELREVADRSGRRQADAADKLRGRVADWIDEGELDPDLGGIALAILEPLAADPGGSGGNGNGNGNGDDD